MKRVKCKKTSLTLHFDLGANMLNRLRAIMDLIVGKRAFVVTFRENVLSDLSIRVAPAWRYLSPLPRKKYNLPNDRLRHVLHGCVAQHTEGAARLASETHVYFDDWIKEQEHYSREDMERCWNKAIIMGRLSQMDVTKGHD